LAGLHYAHTLTDFNGTELKIIHRDVSPQNTFITYDGQVKVMDFGIARAAGRDSYTQTGVIKGKITYMPPEQATGEELDCRADIFAAGIMLYEVAAGKRFWGKDTDVQILRHLVRAEYDPSPKRLDPTVPDEIDRICRKAMEYEREDRYRTAEEMQFDIERFFDGHRGVASSSKWRRNLASFISERYAEERKQIEELVEDCTKHAPTAVRVPQRPRATLLARDRRKARAAAERRGDVDSSTVARREQKAEKAIAHIRASKQAKRAGDASRGNRRGERDASRPRPTRDEIPRPRSGRAANATPDPVTAEPRGPQRSVIAIRDEDSGNPDLTASRFTALRSPHRGPDMRPALAAGAAAGLVVALVAIIGWQMGHQSGATAMSVPAAPVAVMPMPAGAPAAPRPVTVTLQLQSPTPGAQFYLNGQRLGASPFVGRAPSSPQIMTLKVTAPGHQPHERSVVLNSNLQLTIPLEVMVPKATPSPTYNNAVSNGVVPSGEDRAGSKAPPETQDPPSAVQAESKQAAKHLPVSKKIRVDIPKLNAKDSRVVDPEIDY
ncbi:MAG: serine/threonine-protein kinase, partial [Myxococcota bacterium]